MIWHPPVVALVGSSRSIRMVMAPTMAEGKETLQIGTVGSSSTGVFLQKGLHRRQENSYRYSFITPSGVATEPVSRKASDGTAKSTAKIPRAGD